MKSSAILDRRQFLHGSVYSLLGCLASGRASAQSPAGEERPLPIGIRAASLKMAGNLDVFRMAASIPGIAGVELQVTAGKPNLWDWETVRRSKAEAERWGLRIPSLAGIWDRKVNITSPAAADNIRLSVRAAEMLGSGVILVAFFDKAAPDMQREESFGPVVALLRQVAPFAANAGVILGLENSLSPADNAKLVDLVGHPAVRVYYDAYNMATYGHGEQAIPGIALLGRERICAVHIKNGDRRIEELGLIDWAAALGAFNRIGYAGWYVYETAHSGVAECIEDTVKNNAFLRQHVRPPGAP